MGVNAQSPTSSTGALIITIPSDTRTMMVGQRIGYTQVSHDFLIGYSGPLPATGIPDDPYGFNLELECTPWVEIEPWAGYFPHGEEESNLAIQTNAAKTIGNDCLLYFGKDAQDGLPEDLSGLDFEALMKRAQPYLEHAVRFEAAHGINLFVIKEPAYPSANLLNLTVSQWSKLVKLACQTIRENAPQARIIIEIIPQYLPSRSYKPYTFLDDLIRDGVGYDGIMMVFSPPVTARFTREGYPDIAWISSQVNLFKDLGKHLLIRFSGITVVKDETARQTWLEEMYGELFNSQTVVGIYWDETLRYPAELTAVTWPPTPAAPSASPEIVVPILAFIKDRTAAGTVETDANGQAIIYGYAGDYEIQVAGIPGVIKSHIYRGEERRLEVAPENKESPTQTGQVGGPTSGVEGRSGKTEAPKPALIIAGFAATFLIAFGYYIWNKHRKEPKKHSK